MTDERKQFTITAVTSDGQARQEIGGCAASEPYALRVIGDSMEPEFKDGHVIIIDPAMPPDNSAYIIIDYQGETIFRQWVVEGRRKYLKALNASYETLEVTGDYSVRGVVVQRAGRRRQDRKNYY